MQSNQTSAAMSQLPNGGTNMSHAGNQTTHRYRYHLTTSPNSQLRDLVLVKYSIHASTNALVSRNRVRRTSGHKVKAIISALISYAKSQIQHGVKAFSTTIDDLFNYLIGRGLISTHVKRYNFYDVVRFITCRLPSLKMSPGNPSVATEAGIRCPNVKRFRFHLRLILLLLA
jgi:hypothetical protein